VIASGRSVHGAICRGDGIDKARAAEQWHGLGRQLRRHGTGIAERRAKGQPPNPWLGRASRRLVRSVAISDEK
jgi:hypothetical protein